MTIWEAYDRYRIMPNLRLHQLRVAAVAATIARALSADEDVVTKAGLIHDMGNIMKSDFSQFPPEFYGDYDLAYWQAVKEDCGARFGADEHTATAAIARDMGVGDAVIELIDAMGFSKAERIFNEGSPELQILEYADQRVAPYGIVSMEERLREGHARHQSHVHDVNPDNDELFVRNSAVLARLETKLFEGLSITPDSLTEESLKNTVESLRSFVIA